MAKDRVLVVDDEDLIRKWLDVFLENEGYEVTLAEDAAAARTNFPEKSPHAVILDLKLPDGDGMTLLQEFIETDPDIAIIMLSAHGDIDTA
ncbi:MAG: response regulator, partial [Acidimicrobiia bacterium]